MALTSYEKIKVIKYLKDTPMGHIYYLDICQVLSKGRKASYQELIEFLTQYTINDLNKDNASKSLLSKCVSVVSTLLSWLKNPDEVLIGQIRLIKETYNNYLMRNGLDKVEELDTEINVLDNYLQQKYPIANEEQVIAYIKEINSLQDQIKQLTKELKELTSSYEALSKKNKDQEKAVSKKTEETRLANEAAQKSQQEINKLNSKQKELTKTINELQKRLTELENDNNSLNSTNNDLQTLITSLKEEVTILSSKINELESLLTSKEETLKLYADKERRESLLEMQQAEKETQKEEIKELILAKLTSGCLILDELYTDLALKGYEVTIDEVLSYINELKQGLNIVTAGLSPTLKYVIVPPSINYNETFDIGLPADCKSYDILLLSDLHLSIIDEAIISDYDKILDYCAANNIKIILNAGDFFCFKYPFKTEMLKGLTGSKKIVEKAISKLPTSDDVYHAILGGNHDKDALGYGFDAIKMLTEGRRDFIDLGYDHATITFNGQTNIFHSFMLHHPAAKFIDPVLDERFDNDALSQSLDSYYNNVNRKRTNSYIDILGHFHRSGLDPLNGICTVPSLWHDRFNNGAWHMKVYFAEDANIKYIVFKPLILKDKLVATTDIVYQKLILK